MDHPVCSDGNRCCPYLRSTGITGPVTRTGNLFSAAGIQLFLEYSVFQSSGIWMGAGLAGDSVDFDLGNDHLFLACRQDCCPAANSVFALGNICCVFELCYLESESLRGTTPPQVMDWRGCLYALFWINRLPFPWQPKRPLPLL